MSVFKNICVSILSTLAITSLASCGSADKPIPKPEFENYHNQFEILAKDTRSNFDDFDTLDTGFSVKDGSEETRVGHKIDVGQPVNIFAKTYIKSKKNIITSKDHITKQFQQYYVLEGFRQYYYVPKLKVDESNKPILDKDGNYIWDQVKTLYSTLRVDLNEVENPGSSNSITKAIYPIDYPRTLIDGDIREGGKEEQEDMSVYLPQYIEPIYKLHFFLNNEQIDARARYTDSNDTYLAPAISTDQELLDPNYLQGIVTKEVVKPSEEAKVPTSITGIGYDFGLNGEGSLKVEYTFDPTNLNNLNSCDFEMGKYNVVKVNKVTGGTLKQGTNTYVVDLKYNTYLDIALDVTKDTPVEANVILQHNQDYEKDNFLESESPLLTVTTEKGYTIKPNGDIYNGDIKVEDQLISGVDVITLRAKAVLLAKTNDPGYTTYYILKGYKFEDGTTVHTKLISDGKVDDAFNFTTSFMTHTMKAPDRDNLIYPHYEKINVISEDELKAMVSFANKELPNKALNEPTLLHTITLDGLKIKNDSTLLFGLDAVLRLDLTVDFEEALIESDTQKAVFDKFADESNAAYTEENTILLNPEEKHIIINVKNKDNKIKVLLTITRV